MKSPTEAEGQTRRRRTEAEGHARHGERPKTREQWREAVNTAKALLLLEDARAYGLIAGGPVINQPRCEAILQQGAEMCIRPTDEGVDAALRALAGASKKDFAP